MTDTTTTEKRRRHFTRIPFDAEYRLLTPEANKHWDGSVIDLSLHGVLIQRPKDIQARRGDDFILELILSANDINIQMEVQVAHSHDSFIGLECGHIDLESMTHLRRLLELNLGDPSLLERELSEMLLTRANL